MPFFNIQMTMLLFLWRPEGSFGKAGLSGCEIISQDSGMIKDQHREIVLGKESGPGRIIPGSGFVPGLADKDR